MRAPHGPRVWAGPVVYLIALLGTLLSANENARPWAVLLLVASAMLAVVLWGWQDWIPAFPTDATAPTRVNRSRLFYLLGVGMAMLLVLAADLRYSAAPTETFGLAGILWIGSLVLLLCSAFGVPRLRGSQGEPPKGGTPNQVPLVFPRSATDLQSIRWTTWEIVLLAALFAIALLSRVGI